jgi:hypothetical protein
MSFKCSTVLGERVCGVLGGRIDRFSTFWWFSVKLAAVDRVLRAVMVVEGSPASNTLTDGFCEEKTATFGEFSLVK